MSKFSALIYYRNSIFSKAIYIHDKRHVECPSFYFEYVGI